MGCVSKEDPESTGDALILRDASKLAPQDEGCGMGYGKR
jgi:hypothetical protein